MISQQEIKIFLFFSSLSTSKILFLCLHTAIRTQVLLSSFQDKETSFTYSTKKNGNSFHVIFKVEFYTKKEKVNYKNNLLKLLVLECLLYNLTQFLKH